jgi:hypothetical protein
MAKFRVVYKYSRRVDLGVIEAVDKESAIKLAEYEINHNILLRADEDRPPYFKVKKIKQQKRKLYEEN